jgi:membrane associated rhomboid family serine protease
LNHKPDLIYNCAMRTYRAVNLSVLWFLIALNVVIFILEIAIGGYRITGNNEIVRFLGLTPALLFQQPWTIITSMFVHGGILHILFNMIALYFLGSFFIRAAGERNFLAVFFLGGLMGNVLYFVFGYLVLQGFIPPRFGDPFTTGIGASGGVFAVAGALAVIVPRVPVFILFIPIPMPLWIAVIILLVLSFLFSGIAWQAHLGGLLLGLIAGLIFRRRRRIYYF